MKAFHILPALLLIAGCAGGTATSDRVSDRGAEQAAQEFDPRAMVRVADNLRLSGDHMSALRLYARARERDPDNLPALLGEAESLLALGIAGEAERRYRAALAHDGGAPAEAGIARALMQQGRAEEALPHFAAALAAGVATAQIHNHYGVALDLLSRHEEAQQQYGRGLDLAPSDRGLINNLALSLALGGDFDAAVRLLSGLVTETPDAADARGNLALVYGLSGDFAAAEGLIALNEKANLRDAGTGRHQLAFIRQVAALPPELRPRAIILGLEAAMPRIGDAVTPSPESEETGPADPEPETEDPVQGPKVVSPPVPAPEPEEERAGPAAAPAPARAPAPQDGAGAHYGVQLGAYPSEEVAARNWPKIVERAPGILAGWTPHYWPRGTVVRLILPVPQGAEAAARLCMELVGQDIDCLARPFDPATAGSSPLVNEGVVP